MASVTQRIPNYLGGVSTQPDDKKFPGQVKAALNAYPDPTFGLQKRPGLKFLTILKNSSGTAYSGSTLDNAKWFYIHRDNDEKYIGCIVGASSSPYGEIHIWNAVTNAVSTITYSGSSRAYLNALTKDDYHVLTVQDTSIITNKTKAVATQANPTFNLKRNATIRLLGVDYSSPYVVVLTIGGLTYTCTYTNTSSGTADTVLTGIKAAIDAKGISGLAVTKLNTSLEITHTNDFTLTVQGGVDGKQISTYQDSVNNITDLPNESKHGRVIKIINTAGNADDYYAKFIADAGTGTGQGHWEETLGHGMSPGLDAATMPHELVNTGTNAFTFRPVTWTARLVGDDTTNSHPSFNTKTIQQSFFYNNRLGFLSEDNVSMSQAGEFYNFYHITAQTVTASDPVDLNCSSIRPAVLHGIIPVASGLILFSENQQFIMYAADGNLSPQTAIIRGLSNYEMDTKIDPVDVGTNINFVSKTPAYTRVFGLTPRGEGQIPLVNDLGKVVSEYIPQTVDSLIASPQNSFIALFGSTSDLIYFYRTHTENNEEVLKAWFNWKFPGNVLELVVDSDILYTVVKQSNKYHLLSANLSATLEDEAMITSTGIKINPYMDFYSKATNGLTGGSEKKVVYVPTENMSKCYIPYDDITSLNPVVAISGDAASNYSTIVQSGFTAKAERATDSDGTYFKVTDIDLSGQANNVIVGYTFDYDITLPKTYFQLDRGIADYTAPLTISRMRFSVGRSSAIGFKVKSNGYRGQSYDFSAITDGSRTEFSLPFDIQDRDDIKVSINGTNTTNFTITDEGVITMGSAPAATEKMVAYEDNWYDIQPVQEANLYLADDVPFADETVYTVPIHQRTDNFLLRVFSDSPFPVSLTSMMWEGIYNPRYYRRT
tara:strand:- start:1476 stop:4127 length:2652 start_codon:yes stop_codon:yes gene_type:complete